uniref:LAGLIDADG endonuclease n=1 Tax=Morchella brunnea TaxID=1174671 RepID=A0A8K1MGC8_9PEZI|nr:LAGLIDADG endonuclease [Morchella brunnea]UBU98388.1 LAGLIDADG endonuclease [Morchella brunnea]
MGRARPPAEKAPLFSSLFFFKLKKKRLIKSLVTASEGAPDSPLEQPSWDPWGGPHEVIFWAPWTPEREKNAGAGGGEPGHLKCGKCYTPLGYKHVDFRPVVRKTSDIFDKIIPFFNKYPLQGVKVDDYADFCKVAIIKKNKGHLTQVGLEPGYYKN